LSTQSKDFKVKHGLSVSQGGTFGGAVTVGTPTEAGHATTKSYVDALAGKENTVSLEAPVNVSDGSIWLDLSSYVLKMYYDGYWFNITEVSISPDGGSPTAVFSGTIDSGTPDEVPGIYTFDGGIL
jgi:hypothetical protein